MTKPVDKDSLPLNQPRRTPSHPTKSHIVKTKVDGKEKIIRFGQQGASTAGKPKEGESDRMKAKRASFKARHSANIAKGPASAAYWANKVKWADGGSVEVKEKEGVLKSLKKMLSLDSPKDMTTGETAADLAAGFIPGVGTALSARDFERARREDDKLGMALSSLGMIPIVGGMTRVVSRTAKGADELADVIKEQKMLQGFYRGYTGDYDAVKAGTDAGMVFVTPQRKVGEYYGSKRAVQTGKEPHLEMILADPFSGYGYGHSTLGTGKNPPMITKARQLEPKDIKGRTKLYAEGGSVSAYDPFQVDEIMNSIDAPRGYAEGGEVIAPDIEFSENPDALRLYKHAMKQMAPNREDSVSNLGLGLGTRTAGGNFSAGLDMNRMTQGQQDQLMKSLAANYNVNLGDVNVNAMVQKPLDAKDVFVGMLNGSIPLAEGRAMLGIQGVKTPQGSDVLGYNAGWSGKVGPGQLNANINVPKRGKPSGQVQYQIPFAEGGSVSAYDPDQIDAIANQFM
jgi:hypothetical protein